LYKWISTPAKRTNKTKIRNLKFSFPTSSLPTSPLLS
jgi:hypothetical protein